MRSRIVQRHAEPFYIERCSRFFQRQFHALKVRRNDAKNQALELPSDSRTRRRVLEKDQQIEGIIMDCWQRAGRDYMMFEDLFEDLKDNILDKIDDMHALMEEYAEYAQLVNPPSIRSGGYVVGYDGGYATSPRGYGDYGCSMLDRALRPTADAYATSPRGYHGGYGSDDDDVPIPHKKTYVPGFARPIFGSDSDDLPIPHKKTHVPGFARPIFGSDSDDLPIPHKKTHMPHERTYYLPGLGDTDDDTKEPPMPPPMPPRMPPPPHVVPTNQRWAKKKGLDQPSPGEGSWVSASFSFGFNGSSELVESWFRAVVAALLLIALFAQGR